MIRLGKLFFFVFLVTLITSCNQSVQNPRSRSLFNDNWRFSLGDDSLARNVDYDDSAWRVLNLPHDWSIEGNFSKDNPSKPEGGALPTGIGWYRKSFTLDEADVGKKIFIDFDGVFCNSEVWINEHYLGKRPYGYSSFRYDLTPYLNFGDEPNELAVKVDNSAQPASRFYTGSGIYRNVWMVKVNSVFVDHWGTFITTPSISADSALVKLELKICKDSNEVKNIRVVNTIRNAAYEAIAVEEEVLSLNKLSETLDVAINLEKPKLWSVADPYLYTMETEIYEGVKKIDNYTTKFGVRSFEFHPQKGFFLNGEYMKIHGVNQHHDLGALGAAVNVRAMERQLEILRDMGCNAVRMAHNPPASELLDLCDSMGFLVVDESFDEWAKTKAKKGYHLYWDEWRIRDLQDMVLRDRNHPSIIMWSIGNEIREQFDSTGISITRELADAVKALDTTRPVTSALTEQDPKKNYIYQSGALDVISFNYKHLEYLDFPKNYPGEAMIASENVSALATRGFYDMPSDSMRIWPLAYNAPLVGANDEMMVSAYDNAYAYWGSNHEDTWKVVSNHDFISGMFIWSGFDYLGEPIPYPYPARSSYLGIIDLAGFPKDTYYLYQSLWSDSTMLHLFPHWNWKEGQTVDVWAYYNNADEVELFVNGKSQGVRKKEKDIYHVMWRIPFEPGTIKAISRKNGKEVLEKEIFTAGPAYNIELIPDRKVIKADGYDLSFITVKVTDKDGNLVPDADNMIDFEISGPAIIAGVDNGYQASEEPFKANYRKAFNGMCLLIIQSEKKAGSINITAKSNGLQSEEIQIVSK